MQQVYNNSVAHSLIFIYFQFFKRIGKAKRDILLNNTPGNNNK